jgi:FkbM family methyltransferase
MSIDVRGGRPSYVLGTAEPEVQHALADRLAPGGTFIDVGANVGFFTLIGARLVGPDGAVHAFEPVPETAATLRCNVELNHLPQVSVHECALTDETKRVRIATAGSDQEAHIVDDGEEGLELQGAALDDLELDLASADCVIKLDAEGAEHRVLLGMRATAARIRPVIVCELHTLGRPAHHPVMQLLQRMDYSVEWLGDASSAAWAPHLIAVPAEHSPA